MEFTDVVRARRMVRRYRDEPVDHDALERILAAARRAPSAGNAQGQRLVVVTDAAQRRALAEACGEVEAVHRGLPRWLSPAPVHVVVCTRPEDYHERYAERDKAASPPAAQWVVPFWWVDVGATLQTLLLAAVNEGLAAGFVAVPAKAVRRLLAIPDDVVPAGLVTIGHPHPDEHAVGSALRGRRSADEVVRRERW